MVFDEKRNTDIPVCISHSTDKNVCVTFSKVTFFPQNQTILKNRFHAVVNFVIFVVR